MVREGQKENRIARYIRETRAELRKVVWPTREEAVNLTIIVVAAILAMSIFLGAIDYVLTVILRFFIARTP